MIVAMLTIIIGVVAELKGAIFNINENLILQATTDAILFGAAIFLTTIIAGRIFGKGYTWDSTGKKYFRLTKKFLLIMGLIFLGLALLKAALPNF